MPTYAARAACHSPPPRVPTVSRTKAVTASSEPDSDFTWSDEQPTEEGFYWYYEQDFDVQVVVRVFRSSNPKHLVASGEIFEARDVANMKGRWAGPIPAPESSSS